jgi:hypothetical protein
VASAESRREKGAGQVTGQLATALGGFERMAAGLNAAVRIEK